MARIVFGSPFHSACISFEGHDEYWFKRVFTCLGALLMPEAGVDENLESTVDRLQYYREQSTLPALPENTIPNQITASLGRVKQRPELILSDS